MWTNISKIAKNCPDKILVERRVNGHSQSRYGMDLANVFALYFCSS